MVRHCLDKFLPDLGVLVNSPVTYLIQMDLDSVPQPRLTDLYEYLLNFDHFTTIDLHIIYISVNFTNFLFGILPLSVYYILVTYYKARK